VKRWEGAKHLYLKGLLFIPWESRQAEMIAAVNADFKVDETSDLPYNNKVRLHMYL